MRIRQLRGNLGPEVIVLKMIGFDCPRPASIYTGKELWMEKNKFCRLYFWNFNKQWFYVRVLWAFCMCVLCSLTMVAMRDATNNGNTRSARNEKLIRITNVILNIRTCVWGKWKWIQSSSVCCFRCFLISIPASANCSKSNLIWQISGCILRIVSWQLPVPSAIDGEKEKKFFCCRKFFPCVKFTSGFRVIRIHKVRSVLSRHTTATCWRRTIKFWSIKSCLFLPMKTQQIP